MHLIINIAVLEINICYGKACFYEQRSFKSYKIHLTQLFTLQRLRKEHLQPIPYLFNNI